ncbi:MAG: hypothetical protein LBT14_05090 [Treponema sp.]|jgi:hypothetical protein|nr:hypothetical protein [Treponema sp.]
MHSLTLLENDIITYLIAENEETGEQFEIAPYMYAFSGEYSKHTPFFLGQPENGRIVLFVQKEQFFDDTVHLTQFTQQCKEIKQRLYNIADFIIYLVQRDYLRTIHKSAQEQIACPTDFPDHWHRYDDFTIAENKAFTFLCSMHFIPRLKLYKYWTESLKK